MALYHKPVKRDKRKEAKVLVDCAGFIIGLWFGLVAQVLPPDFALVWFVAQVLPLNFGWFLVIGFCCRQRQKFTRLFFVFFYCLMGATSAELVLYL